MSRHIAFVAAAFVLLPALSGCEQDLEDLVEAAQGDAAVVEEASAKEEKTGEPKKMARYMMSLDDPARMLSGAPIVTGPPGQGPFVYIVTINREGRVTAREYVSTRPLMPAIRKGMDGMGTYPGGAGTFKASWTEIIEDDE